MNIRHTVIRIGAGLLLAGLASSAFAAGSVQATANATLTILSPTTLTKTQDMVFGQVVASTTSSAKFNVTAAAATTYTTSQTLTFVQAGLTNISAGTPVATTGTLGTIGAGGGTQEIRYGGQFDITAATPAQNYTGTLTVTVNYN